MRSAFGHGFQLPSSAARSGLFESTGGDAAQEAVRCARTPSACANVFAQRADVGAFAAMRTRMAQWLRLLRPVICMSKTQVQSSWITT